MLLFRRIGASFGSSCLERGVYKESQAKSGMRENLGSQWVTQDCSGWPVCTLFSVPAIIQHPKGFLISWRDVMEISVVPINHHGPSITCYKPPLVPSLPLH